MVYSIGGGSKSSSTTIAPTLEPSKHDVLNQGSPVVIKDKDESVSEKT